MGTRGVERGARPAGLILAEHTHINRAGEVSTLLMLLIQPAKASGHCFKKRTGGKNILLHPVMSIYGIVSPQVTAQIQIGWGYFGLLCRSRDTKINTINKIWVIMI